MGFVLLDLEGLAEKVEQQLEPCFFFFRTARGAKRRVILCFKLGL